MAQDRGTGHDPAAGGDGDREGARSLVEHVGAALGPAVAAEAAGNMAWSPASAALAMALVRCGASGSGSDQIDAVIGSRTDDELDAAITGIFEAIAELDGEPADATLAGAMWPDSSLRLRPGFVERVAAVGAGTLHTVDYQRNPDEARRAIDAWVAEMTRGQMSELLPPSAVTKATRLVIANALHLAAPWADRFHDEPNTIPFTTGDGRRIEAPMFTGAGTWPVHDGDGYVAVTIPHGGRRSGFTVILPDPTRFEDVEARFHAGELSRDEAERDGGAPDGRVELTWPGCGIDTRIDLTEVLRSSGVEAIFTEPRALDAMVAVTDDDPGVVASAVLHRATVRADRYGTEASAATAVVIMVAGMPPAPTRSIVVDRPFLFRIEALDGGPVLFAGRVDDPTG